MGGGGGAIFHKLDAAELFLLLRIFENINSKCLFSSFIF